MKSFSRDELAQCNGEDGKAALVAVNGNVYDVSSSKRWPKGTHMNRHRAGTDLSVDIQSAPHGTEVLERVPLVGSLMTESLPKPEGLRGKVEDLLVAYPWFRRHPHPAIVHFPLGLLVIAPVFEAIAIAIRSEMTEWAGVCCLVGGLVSLPPTLATGYFTWWINYDFKDSRTIRTKRIFAWLSLGLALSGVGTRILVGVTPVDPENLWVFVYFLNLVVLAGAVSFTGFLGGTLTFPYQHSP